MPVGNPAGYGNKGVGGGGALLSTFYPDGSGAKAFGPHRMPSGQASMPAYGTPSGRTRHSRMPGENSPLVRQVLGDGPIANRQRTSFGVSDDMMAQIREARSTGGSTAGAGPAQPAPKRRPMRPGRKLGIKMGGFGGTAGPAQAAPAPRSSANVGMGGLKGGYNAAFAEAIHARDAEAFNRRTGAGTPRGRAPRGPMNPTGGGGGTPSGTSAPRPRPRSSGGRFSGLGNMSTRTKLAVGAGALVLGAAAYGGRRGEGTSSGRSGMTRY